jgi:beta-lactamase superfamily II metal-dependent hydrolase
VSAASVRVRMYNVGFGDAFLLFLPGKKREIKVLVDCGSIANGPVPMKDVVAQIVADATEQPGGDPRIDVVIATHRHLDHISGFALPAWSKVKVDEVWMPWTENPDDARARAIVRTQTQLAARLRLQIETRLRAGVSGTSRQRALRALAMALNAHRSDKPMQTLRTGFQGSPKRFYLPDAAHGGPLFPSAALPGVEVHVLGPSRIDSVIRDMDPPAGKSYLQMISAAAGGVGAEEVVRPPDLFRSEFAHRSLDVLAPNLKHSLTMRERRDIQAIADEDEELLAASMEKSVNGTSLMLVLQVGKARLLLAGDAQWGTWNAVLQDPHGRSLLEETTFYKVGHHGSHNATPIEFVEHVIHSKTFAMVSTKRVKSYPNVPREPLLQALKQHSVSVARSDKAGSIAGKFKKVGSFSVELELPT